MHTANHLAGPVQIIFIPFMRIGEGMLGLEHYPLDLADLFSQKAIDFVLQTENHIGIDAVPEIN